MKPATTSGTTTSSSPSAPMADRPGRGARLVAWSRTVKGAMLLSAVVVVAFTFLRPPAEGFIYDAENYWYGGLALVTGDDFYELGRLDLRGALSVVIYLPAILIRVVFGAGVAGYAVLAQNALLIALLGSWIIPGLVRLFGSLRSVQVWVSALLTAILLSGFAPFPMMDLPALVLVFLGVLLIAREPVWWRLLLAGVAWGVAVNVRPAYLVPLGLALVVWLAFRWRHALWPLVGVAATLVPQVAVNRLFAGVWRLWPDRTFQLASFQAETASYIVRYDTIPFVQDLDPRQIYCYPEYAQALEGKPLPTGTVELLQSYLQNLPQSLDFMVRKVAGALQWTWATPYSDPPPLVPGLLAVLAVGVAAAGLLAIIRSLVRRQLGGSMLPMIVLAVFVGALATIVVSAPEARFAAPLVATGILGVVLAIPTRRPWPWKVRPATIGWIGGAMLLTLVLLAWGLVALDYPAASGPFDLESCLNAG